jgi:flagellin-like hook-associated protein FlgL
MVTDVGNILDGAQSARLNAIKQTARKLDDTSLRLATGLDVNSAIDDPQNYFTALALRNRASDLSRLIDGIGQSIRTVELADKGVTAGLKILDQAEAYLADIEKKYLAGEIDKELVPDTSPPSNETYVTFAGPGDLVQYISGQDAPASGPITVTGDNEVTLNGNFWKRKAINYNVTADTVLLFEFRSTSMPEIAAIGFDNDTNFGNDNDRFFLYGSQTSGITFSAPVATFQYNGSGDWMEVEIPIGLYFTGNYSHLTFVHDDDLPAPFGNASYRNITLREGPEEIPNDVEQVSSALQRGYENIVGQLDLLVKDAHYRGINLLKDEDLTTYFNPKNTSFLVSEGIDATYQGLGIDTADFNSIDAVYAKLEDIREARQQLRAFGTTLANNLSIITTRRDLTEGQITTSKAGADDLTIADQNEEGANMLALQTRQQVQMSILALRTPTILSILS